MPSGVAPITGVPSGVIGRRPVQNWGSAPASAAVGPVLFSALMQGLGGVELPVFVMMGLTVLAAALLLGLHREPQHGRAAQALA